MQRGKIEDGGNLLAKHGVEMTAAPSDAMMLAYLAIAAWRIGDASASEHFGSAFRQVNRSRALQNGKSAAAISSES